MGAEEPETAERLAGVDPPLAVPRRAARSGVSSGGGEEDRGTGDRETGGPEDQRTGGPETGVPGDRRTGGPETGGPRDQRTGGPGDRRCWADREYLGGPGDRSLETGGPETGDRGTGDVGEARGLQD
ncbi:unnamed protein product [Arctogadus glacialis]